LIFSIFSYLQIQNKISSYTPLTEDKFELLLWLRNNTPKNSTILYYNSFDEWNSIFSERLSFESNKYVESEDCYDGIWVGFSLNLPEKVSYYNWQPRRQVNITNYLEVCVNINQFDYIVTQKDYQYIIPQEYKIVYQENNYIIANKP
ncbi:hypothetical protein ACFL1H_03765, partial [Nanoarchaeota archaeon]